MASLTSWEQEHLLADSNYLNWYQESVSTNVIVWDEGGETIGGGKDPYQYMLDGLIEEIDETMQSPNHRKAYDRRQVLIGGLATHQSIDPVDITNHQKEFGDVSWYNANLLKLAGIGFRQAVILGIEAESIAARNQPRCDEAGYHFLHNQAPFAPYIYTAETIIDTATRFVAAQREMKASRSLLVRAEMAPQPTSDSEAIEFGIASGRFTLNMARIVKSVFDVDYRTILDQNIAKIEGRIARGTVLSEQGGDDR